MCLTPILLTNTNHMEIIQKEFKVSYNEEINIYTLGDIHEGNVNHAEAEFKEAIKIIKNDPNGYWIGMGDYIEAITPNDKKRFDPTTIADKYKIKDLKNLPKKQMDHVFEKIKPIQDKCLCLLTGNHEETFSKHNENDVYDYFVNLFDNPPPKMGYTGFIKLRFTHKTKQDNLRSRAGGKVGKVPSHLASVVIYCNHGDGGNGFLEGYGINKLHQITRGIDADINLMGHVHLLAENSLKITGLNSKNGLTKRIKYWGISGCFLYTYLEGNTNYFEHKGRPESPIGMLKISLKIDQEFRLPRIQVAKIQLG